MPNERIYATVNESNLTETDFHSLVPEEFINTLTPTHKKEIVKEWIDTELLYQEAVKLGIDKEPRIARILEKTRRDLLSSELLARRAADITTPSDDELNKYYESNSDFFVLQNDEYLVRYALFDTIENARNFYNKVKRGDSFSDLAKVESKDTSARDGGSLGTVNEESIEPAVWNEIINTYQRLGVKKISSPFNVVEGFGIVIVDEVYKAGSLKPFEMVRDQVLDYYMREKREEAKKVLIEGLEKKAKIEYMF